MQKKKTKKNYDAKENYYLIHFGCFAPSEIPLFHLIVKDVVGGIF